MLSAYRKYGRRHLLNQTQHQLQLFIGHPGARPFPTTAHTTSKSVETTCAGRSAVPAVLSHPIPRSTLSTRVREGSLACSPRRGVGMYRTARNARSTLRL